MIRRTFYTKENTPIINSLDGSVSIEKMYRPIEFPKIGQFHFTKAYKPVVSILLEVISFLLLIPLLLIVAILLLLTGKVQAFDLRSHKKKLK